MPSGVSRKVLIAVDDSPFAHQIIDWSLSDVLRPEDKVILVHVREPAVYLTGNVGFMVEIDSSFKKIQDANLQRSEELLSELGKKLQVKGLQVKSYSLLGDPRDVIIKQIQQDKPDFVIVGRHGKGHRMHMLMGSVSKYLVHHAQVPVTIISGQ
jgi:nucleotide-binding universal stress UspA family protein